MSIGKQSVLPTIRAFLLSWSLRRGGGGATGTLRTNLSAEISRKELLSDRPDPKAELPPRSQAYNPLFQIDALGRV